MINFKNITNGVRTNIIRLQLSLKFIQLIFKKCLKIGDIQKNYSEVLKILKETDSRKYNSSKLFLSEKIYAKNQNQIGYQKEI